ncbi:MAG: SUMF1/EgtB/PvdO family nonheme iron enzyme, partial [Rikenellaceae bacterium]
KKLYTWVDFNLPYDGVQRHNPHKSLDGNTYDQYERRIELSKKYAGNPVYWKEELDKYGEYLKSQPKPEPVMPEQQKVEVKEVKVKGWPFSQEVAEEMVKGKEKRVVDLGNGQSMTFVYIPKGTFIAGGSGTKGQAMPTKVAIKKGFWMAEKEVSNEQIRALLPDHSSRYVGQQWKDHTTPGYFVDSCHLAATKVSFNDAMLFSEKLSEKSGFNVTLPTSEQWEWAARSGSNEDFWYGSSKTDFSKYENLADVQLNDMAVIGVDPKPMGEQHSVFRFQAYIPKDVKVDDGSMLMTAPGSYLPNHWGLYDINGNVAEWTLTNGDGENRIVKGGSWYDRAKKVTVSDNREFLPWHEVWNVGFRPIIVE